MRRILEVFFTLTKFRIACLSTLSAAAGYVSFARALRLGLAAVLGGLLLTALGACALNEWQDRDLDARMERTRRRPIPAGRITPGSALAIAAALIALGLAVLAVFVGPAPALLGAAAVLWYNGVYSHLKRAWAFAAVPGALVGAIPPAIGWRAAGGSLGDPGALGLATFFFLWQTPHFWLLLLSLGREYEAAGLPSPRGALGEGGIARLTFLWSLFAAGSSLLLWLSGVVASPAAFALLLAVGSAFALGSLGILRAQNKRAFRKAFFRVNAYAGAVLAIVILDALALR